MHRMHCPFRVERCALAAQGCDWEGSVRNTKDHRVSERAS